jgi:hypothetical protein
MTICVTLIQKNYNVNTVPGLEIEWFYEIGTSQSLSDRKFKS